MHHPNFPRRQSGFTLVEIAIVLVIIGLLLGGILKGQELINSARVKNLAADFRNVPLYIYGYQDKFRALPGDDKAANAHVGTTTAEAKNGDGDGVIEGDWDATGVANESLLFWQHVRLAGLAPGPISLAAADFQPRNAVGGVIGVQSEAPFTGINGTYFICSGSILGKFAKQLDTQLDDGDTAAGSVMVGTGKNTVATSNDSDAAAGSLTVGTGKNAVATDKIVDSDVYTVCMGI